MVDGGGDPYREPLDVPVINASRGELGPTSPVWTGSEAVFFTPSLWVGRMDAEGRELGRAQLPIEGTVSMETYPVWRDGTISAVFETYPPGPGGPKARWISARPDGTLVSDVPLEAASGWVVLSQSGVVRGDELLLSTALDQGVKMSREPFPFGMATFDLSGHRKSSVPFADCEVPGGIVGTSWGYVVTCHYDRFVRDEHYKPRPARVVGFRDGREAWAHEVPAGAQVTLGSDGQQTLILYKTEEGMALDVDDVAKLELLDADGRLLRTTTTSTMLPEEYRRPLVWTGKEYAAVSGRWIYRYSGDGEVIGVWTLEPQCRRSFQATGLAWTGTAYLVTGGWGWQSCMDGFGKVRTDESYLVKPLAPGLRWDPAADALEAPDDDDW